MQKRNAETLCKLKEWQVNTMNLKKLTAAVITAAITVIPIPAEGLSTQYLSNVYAKEVSAEAALPDWIPTDFESALEFRNTYGATHVEDGIVCIVFREHTEKEPDESSPRYVIKTTDGVMKELSRSTYDTENYPYCYEVVVYSQTQETGDFEVALVDTWVKSSGLDLGYSHAVAYYTFSVVKDEYVTETDIYSWLPDCAEEYKYYSGINGNISTHDNYIVFCLDHNAGTPYTWQERSHEYAEYAKLRCISECTEETSIPLDGGAMHDIYVYQAVKDGRVRIDMDFGDLYSGEAPTKTLTADCVIINGAETVLLPDSAKIAITDYNTGKPIEMNKVNFYRDLTATTADGQTAMTTIIASMYSNPGIVRGISKYIKENDFGFNFTLPKGYKYATDENGQLLSDAVAVKKLENGSADVVIKLKKTSARTIPAEKSAELTDLKKGETRITVKDADTGKLIPDSVLGETPLLFAPYICSRGARTILTYTVDSNNKIFDDDLAEYFRTADEFSFWDTDLLTEPEVTLYDNGSMEAVFSIKTSSLAQTDLFPREVRVTLLNCDTGELIPDEDLENAPFEFRPLTSDATNSTYYSLKHNPSKYQHSVLSSACISGKLKGFWNNRGDDQPEIKLYDNGSADIVFSVRLSAGGDVNGDGSFNIADVVVFQKWLLNPKDNPLRNFRAADLCTDDRLDVFDLCLMKKKLMESIKNAPEVFHEFEAQYIRTDGYVEGAEYPQTKFIKSRSEIESYIEANKDIYDLSSRKSDSAPDAAGFADAVEKYTDQWFESHKLLIVLVEDGSGSTRFNVSQVSDRCVQLYRISDMIGTCDMAEWHILIELDKDAVITNEENYKAEFVKMAVIG